MKIVINDTYGGFSVSKAVYEELGKEWDGYGFLSDDVKTRSDPKLIAAIEKLGIKASNHKHSSLKIIEIPDDVEVYIDDYDGEEIIHEVHRSWS